MDRLEHDAQTDMDVRREYARELIRRGDARGSLLELSIQPGTDAWLEIHKVIEGDDVAIQWLSSYLMHWTKLDLEDTKVSILAPLKAFTNLEGLALNGTQVSNLLPRHVNTRHHAKEAY